jgi:phosphoribosyl 1,2-cyclic phosphodiesterase
LVAANPFSFGGNMARFCPLFSGSTGNSYYIGSATDGILIDAGRSAKQILEMLKACDIDPAKIRAIFVTHEHSDHVSGLRVLASRLKIPVYASSGTLDALKKMGCVNDKIESFVIPETGIEAAGMKVSPFPIPHDSAECSGYRIDLPDGRKIALSTDLGYLSEEVRNSLEGSDLVVLESNHDVRMLENGPYPYVLKRRILSKTGHLSNDDCAAELEYLVRNGSTRFVLAHLSRENNTPELAFQTSLCSLRMSGMKQGIDFELYVAPIANTETRTIVF